MGAFVKGIGALFGGGGGQSGPSAAEQMQLASIAQQRTKEAQDAAADTTNQALAGIAGAPRGQRLLVSAKDGGLATTLGGSA